MRVKERENLEIILIFFIRNGSHKGPVILPPLFYFPKSIGLILKHVELNIMNDKPLKK